jgi:hypothetical protein
MSSYSLYPLIGFEAQTNKPCPTWFRGPNQETNAVILWPKSPNLLPLGLEAQTKKPSLRFCGLYHRTVDLGFDAYIMKLSYLF